MKGIVKKEEANLAKIKIISRFFQNLESNTIIYDIK